MKLIIICLLLMFFAYDLHAQQAEDMKVNEQLYRLEDKRNNYRNILLNNSLTILPEGLSLKFGDTSHYVKVIKNNLFLMDLFLRDDTTTIFNGMLTKAITNIQKICGLEASGIIDTATAKLLNDLPSELINKIEVNIRRWDVFISDSIKRSTDLYIIANIPDFSLSVINCDTVGLYMKAIYGRPSHKTPLISGNISHLVVNPSWIVPNEISKKEIFPMLKKDNQYLKRNHMILYERYDHEKKEINPDSVDWSRMTISRFNYSIEQIPGPWNALGSLKFYFPNNLNVYLHDTPEKYLFARTKRAYSHGCIRLEKPLELAAYLFFDNYLLENIKEVERLIETGEPNIYIRLPVATPLFICYFSAWVDDSNQLQIREDIYNYDNISNGQ